jgi:catechol 2,3-dioxygenase-like lactoylglutathione lyase family enzyme
MKYWKAFLLLFAFLFKTTAPAFSQEALGVNYNQFLRSIQEQELNQVNATWLRGFIDMHLVGDQDPSQDPNIQAILDARAHGRRTILNLKWNYHTQPFPTPGSAAMTQELDQLNRLLPVVMSKVDILVIGNEPFIETEPSQSGQPLIGFYQIMANDVRIVTKRSPAVFGGENTGVRHVGLYARDPASTAEFYRDVLGMHIVGGSSADDPVGATAFLSSRPEEESHELALFANQDFRHFAFRVASLAELRSFYYRVLDRKLEVKMALNHGASVAFYFTDPDGNMVEVHWRTGIECRQPFLEPIDLSETEESIRAKLGLEA